MKNLLTVLVPHYFTKEPIPEITHPDLLRAIEQVKNAPTTQDAIREALELLRQKYKSGRLLTYILFFRWFETDPNKLWQRTGYLHCTHLNYLFRVLMVKSGWLKDENIQHGYSLVWYISPHQYVSVEFSNQTIAVDPWHYNLNGIIGKYASGFGMRELKNS